MTKVIFEGVLAPEYVDYEDGGAAIIAEADWDVQGGDENIFVRIQSWDESIFDNPLRDSRNSRIENAQLGHKTMHELIGKKIRVTVEVID